VKSRKNEIHDPDPWDARTIEWGTSSPPPAHNFDVEPVVSHLDEWWHRKYETNDQGKMVRREKIEYLSDPDFDASSVHLPSPSYWPIVIAFGLPLISYGLIYTYWLSAVGGLIVLAGLYGWAMEPSVDPDAGHAHLEGGHDDPEPEPVSVGAGSGEEDA